ncbi:Folylpolyglutamate synthetase [Coemansia sp. RSA 2523]|nr:Folylpolyglutamate synthetase [Coemansia sp. RSA 2523]KAJ2552559.1 Folylpolyglutamate synthetase [Coemansia sp. RSA 1878]KAJ2728401.1 Folylpolyglutamate synthetase [Coemansia sp. D1744]
MDTSVPAGSYLAAVRDLNGLQTNYQIIQQIKASGGRMNQHSIPEFCAFLEKIGHSVKDLDKLNVIHVAGTKGKGSTCAFTQSILTQLSEQRRAEGKQPLKIGLFTSPHLIQVRERIQINGQPISQLDFAKYFYETFDALRSPHPPLRKVSVDSPSMPMYFRFLTLMAYHTFLREQVDVAIMEVGVGGEYDSTNVVQQPVVCGIASLGIDHQNSLGSTIEEIAWHKAGIIKPKVPVVSVEQVPEALKVIEERARENDAELQVVKPVDDVELGIQGVHQRANAALATELCRTWVQRTHNVAASESYIARGLQLASWPGRSQSFPSPRVPSLIWHVDGAHTVESIRACAKWFSSTSSPCVLLFNAAHNRDARMLLETLHTHASCTFIGAVFCPNVSTQRADSNNFTVQKDDELVAQWESARVWQELTGNPVKVVPSINEAVEYVENTYEDVRVLATGSLHLVGGVLDVAKGSI